MINEIESRVWENIKNLYYKNEWKVFGPYRNSGSHLRAYLIVDANYDNNFC